MSETNHELEEMKRLGQRWMELNGRIKRTTKKRDDALWLFLTGVAHIAKKQNLRGRKRIRRLIRKANPSLDAKARSRYVTVVRAVVRKKTDDKPVREWVRSHGGIAKCR